MQAYLFDEDYGLYLLSGRFLTFYLVGTVDNSIQLKKFTEFTLGREFSADDAAFVRVEGAVYLSDGKIMSRVTIDEQGRSMSLGVVSGFESLTRDSKLVKLVKGINKKEMYVLGTSSVDVYDLTDFNTFQRKKDSLPATLSSPANSYVDMVVTKDCVCLLDFLQGLFVVKGSAVKHYEMPYGSAEKMEVVGDTL